MSKGNFHLNSQFKWGEVVRSLPPESPAQLMLDWLVEASASKDIFQQRYHHYQALTQEVNGLLELFSRKPCQDEKDNWLKDNYFAVLARFFWQMETFCYQSILAINENDPETDSCQLTTGTDIRPEFSFDPDQVRIDYLDDYNRQQQIIRQHQDSIVRIESILTLADFVEGDSGSAMINCRAPLNNLLRAHHSLLYCAEFGRFMLTGRQLQPPATID